MLAAHKLKLIVSKRQKAYLAQPDKRRATSEVDVARRLALPAAVVCSIAGQLQELGGRRLKAVRQGGFASVRQEGFAFVHPVRQQALRLRRVLRGASVEDPPVRGGILHWRSTEATVDWHLLLGAAQKTLAKE